MRKATTACKRDKSRRKKKGGNYTSREGKSYQYAEGIVWRASPLWLTKCGRGGEARSHQNQEARREQHRVLIILLEDSVEESRELCHA